MKKRTALMLLILLLAGIKTAMADYAVVANTSSLNLRAGPGYDFEVLASASRGEWVNIMETYNGWDYVTVVSTGKVGYMVDSYLNRASSADGSTGIVKNQSAKAFLNLREYPSYSAKVLGIYYNGATCQVLGYDNGWYMVEIDSMIGYFRREYLVVNGSSSGATVIASNGKPVNLRSGPSTSFGALTQLTPGTKVSVLLKGNRFWEISANGFTGFMSSAYLSKSGGSSGGNSGGGSSGGGAAPATNGYVIVSNPNASRKVNLRATPSTSAKVLAQYENGTRFEMIEGGLTWCKVYGKSSGRIGYMMTKYLTVYGVPGTPVKTVSNGNSYVNLRSAPSKSSGTVRARVNSGEQVTVLIPGDEWTQVQYGNTTGYMMSYFLK
ncbi:MAG: SH3 domain-containing protein [Clostridia bacterium]|nr:SH3 domain-containing protein [Clostridia bacterium]